MSKEFLKRVIPFAAALTLGLFVASFFVTVAAPRFSFKRSERRQHQHRKIHKLELENQRLRESLAEAQMRLAETEIKRAMQSSLEAETPMRLSEKETRRALNGASEIENDFDSVPLAPPVPAAPERIR